MAIGWSSFILVGTNYSKKYRTFIKWLKIQIGPFIIPLALVTENIPFFSFRQMKLILILVFLQQVGDRSLMYVIAHEIAHSWSGNLVSVKNYEHFWLNEGVSTFIERKIGGRSKGEPYRHFRAIGGLRELRHSVSEESQLIFVFHIVKISPEF